MDIKMYGKHFQERGKEQSPGKDRLFRQVHGMGRGAVSSGANQAAGHRRTVSSLGPAPSQSPDPLPAELCPLVDEEAHGAAP